MGDYAVYILLGLMLAVAAALLVVNWKYRQWPPSVWARRMQQRVHELRGRLDNLLHPPASERSAAEMLRDDLFARQKQSVSVETLSRYTGIGPKIVEWLQNSGIRTLTKAEEHANAFLLFKKKIEGVGEKREQDIANAVRDAIADERYRFDAGTSQQGAEYQSRMIELGAAEAERAAAKDRERRALEQCLERFAPLEALARDVTLSTWLTSRKVPGLTDEVMAAPLPSVEIPAAPPPAATKYEAPKPDGVLPSVARLQAYCRFAMLVAKSDGRIGAAERAAIRSYLGDQFGSDPVLLRHLDPQLEAAEANIPEEADAFAAIRNLTEKAEWVAIYSFAEQIADAMGDRTEKEKQFLARLAEAFELSPAEPEPSAPPPPPAPASTARDVLGIPAKAELTVELIRRKYTMLTEQICPEKAAALGPEFAKMADAKRAAVKAAAEELLAPFNAPLEAPEAPPPPTDLRHNPQLDDIFGANRG